MESDAMQAIACEVAGAFGLWLAWSLVTVFWMRKKKKCDKNPSPWPNYSNGR